MKQDYVLQALMVLAEKPNNTIQLAITVNVQGVLMAGHVISKATYQEGVQRAIQQGAAQGDDASDRFVEVVNALLTMPVKPLERDADGRFKAPEPDPTPEHDDPYMHLGNVSVLNFQGGEMIRHAVWRIRLDDISAFTIGHPKINYDPGSGCNYQGE